MVKSKKLVSRLFNIIELIYCRVEKYYDLEKAAHFFEIAADQGNLNAQSKLKLMQKKVRKFSKIRKVNIKEVAINKSKWLKDKKMKY